MSSDQDTHWESYSDYQAVTKRVASSVDNAIDAYAQLHSMHTEGAGVTPELAAEVRGRILSAALRLQTELTHNRNSKELYDNILSRWEGDEGYIRQLSETRLQNECPGWLLNFVTDIRQAGWELGYLRAGKQKRDTPDDPDKEQIEQMLGGMN